MRLAERERLVPDGMRQVQQRPVGAVVVVERHRRDRQPLVAAGLAVGGAAVVADHPQHRLGVLGIAGEGAQLLRHLGRGGIGDAGHDRGQRAAERPALVAVIAQPHVHQQAADIGVAEAEGAELVAQLRDRRAGELRHHHADLERDHPQPGGVDIGLGVELAVLQEGQQVHRRQVAGRVVQEHVFRARVRAADLPVFRAGVPGVDRVVELDARIGAGPGGVADLLPQLARLDGLGDLAVGAADQLPVGILADGAQEGVGDPHRVVRVLAGDGQVGVRVPVGVVGRELDRGEALLGVLQDPLDVGVGDHGLLRRLDRRLERRVALGIEGVGLGPVPSANGCENIVQPGLMQFGPRDKRRHLLLLDDLPVDEVLDIRVIHVADHHLRCSTGCPA